MIKQIEFGFTETVNSSSGKILDSEDVSMIALFDPKKISEKKAHEVVDLFIDKARMGIDPNPENDGVVFLQMSVWENIRTMLKDNYEMKSKD